MIDCDELVWMTKDDFKKEITERAAAVRDLLNDMEVLVASYANDRNLTRPEVAEYLRCEPASIPKEIPCAHIGRNWIYKMCEVEKWLRKNTRSKKDIPDKLF